MTSAVFKQVHAPRLRLALFNALSDEAADIRDAMQDIFVRGPVEPLEATHSLSVLAFGLWMFFVPVLESQASALGYYGMREFARILIAVMHLPIDAEHLWGLAAIALGLLQMYGVSKGRHHIRRVAAMGEAMMFAFVLGALAIQNWRFVATIVFSTYAAISLWIFIRLGFRSSTAPIRDS